MVLIGDIHGEFGVINRLGISNCNVMQVGDFGLGFSKKDMQTMEYWNESWKSRDIHVYAIRGNHDNPMYWDGTYEGKWSNIHLVPDYTVLELEGESWLCIGGATSIDRVFRKQDRDYWKDEVFNYDEEKLHSVLKSCGYVDYVVTHTAPQFCYPIHTGSLVDSYCDRDAHLRLELQVERELLTRAHNIICSYRKPEAWFYGHFHASVTEVIDGVKFKLLGVEESTNV